MVDARDTITKAIQRSQHCQRNWDLDRQIPDEDLELLHTAATQCPSKQNVAFYRTHFITNRELIEKIHDQTRGFNTQYGMETNSQVLANLLVVLEEYTQLTSDDIYRNEQTDAILNGQWSDSDKMTLNIDQHMAVGVAAGYLNLTASMLGYATGCCACFNGDAVREILGLESSPLLLMGIGFKNPEMNRRVHHTNHDFVFPTKIKQEIPFNVIR